MNPCSNDSEEMEAILFEIRDKLPPNGDSEALKRSLGKCKNCSSSAQFTLDLLAPYLFRESSQNEKMTSHDALSIIQVLVASDAPEYLKPASRAVKSEAVRLASSEHPMIVSQELMGVLISQLSGNDVEVSSNAIAAIVACCRKLGPRFADPAIRAIHVEWKQFWSHMRSKAPASTVCVRCASAMVDMVILDDSIMKSAIDCGASDLLLTMLTYDTDPLLQMTTLDLIEKMASTRPMHRERANWLFSASVLEPLLEMAGGNEDGYADPILGGPALRVVAVLCKLGKRDSTLFELTDNLLKGFHRALHHFKESGEVDRLALIDAISSFASASPDALDLVLNDTSTREGWLSLSVAQPKLKSVVLFSVAMLLDPPTEIDANGDSLSPSYVPSNTAGMRLYTALGSTNGSPSTELLLSLAKSPLPETRLATYELLKAVAKMSTGAQKLFLHGGFYEFLINREGEETKEGREAKYSLVQAIVDSEASKLLADDITSKLKKYLEEGPHYVKTLKWELATQ